MALITDESSETAILARVLGGEHGALSVSMARYILSRGFSDADKARMRDLAERNQDADLNDEEKAALKSYVKAGNVLSVLKAKARRVLRERKRS